MTEKERNELVEKNIATVTLMAKRIIRQSQPSYDDVRAAGLLALVEASRKYDKKIGENFMAYASRRIRGAMIDHMRKEDIIGKTVRRTINLIRSAKAALRQNDMPVSEESVILEASITRRKYRNAIDAAPLSLPMDEYREDDEESPLGVLDDGKTKPVGYEIETAEIIMAVMSSLSHREKKIINMYYGDQMGIAEISKHLNISQPTVSSNRKKIISKLSKLLSLKRTLM